MAGDAGRDTQRPGSEPGTYALLLQVERVHALRVGSLGPVRFEPGFYLYVGSALGPGGLRGRVARHLRGAARPHWHVDHLRRVAEPAALWYSCDPVRREHLWARLLGGARGAHVAARGFGASDCTCTTHLLRFRDPPSLSGFRRRLRAHFPDHARVESLRVRPARGHRVRAPSP